jgi:hypothetical protein
MSKFRMKVTASPAGSIFRVTGQVARALLALVDVGRRRG